MPSCVIGITCWLVSAGISAAARIKKSCLVLCTNSVSVDQWRYQFTLWSTLQQEQVRMHSPGAVFSMHHLLLKTIDLHAQINRFTSEHKEMFIDAAAVCITTYTMIAYSGRRSEDAEKVSESAAQKSCQQANVCRVVSTCYALLKSTVCRHHAGHAADPVSGVGPDPAGRGVQRPCCGTCKLRQMMPLLWSHVSEKAHLQGTSG